MPDCRSDKELLCITDAEEGFRLLYERYWEPLYKKALSRLGNDADAQDVIQEIFISLWRNRQTIDVQESLSYYLFTALKYSIIKRVERQARRGITLPLDLSMLEQTTVSAEEYMSFRELQQQLARELSLLPPRMQEIYQLRRVDNLPVGEIAQQLSLSEQTVKNTLHAAVKRLRQQLSKYQLFQLFF
ncbi:RNA polymerase sigma factor [Flavihumibacter petaseus]|uniref:Putative RNA polymerase ECF-type sigma factor n=1 Tax=Flavihumibacter petaseus NBRC 106054 TaxID=1220578 RepID=A0A0E9MWC7_9BACT|nr:sigma-70 family RNA polymerase sigma factor [Flavihumibacter petaseus]GAO42042.1 putative RNA polymerase ECF-type sigma factor [Flavihumibacter petaseus NBRC 106054]